MRFSRGGFPCVPRQRQTEAERALWQCWRGHRLLGLKFRRQRILGSYIVDFVCHEPMLAIELDGGPHVDSPVDRLRDAWLESRGQGTAVLEVRLGAVESWGEGGTKEPAARVLGGFFRETALPSSSPDFPTLPQPQCNHSVTNPDRFVTRDPERLNRLGALQAQTCSE
ncbi:endonuclease domain-containing protein [Pseudomonas aeruginosa]|uniref:endonuclease domain-containing protein n=1 Tax=Pseudomonas aeruginosa TaxID=287 RepID=UPI001969851D|nr:endonuclease domain-containing protein [Pseudomonas aeruginosa]MBH8873343.1 endonuclease domain-containing protein [Pseudomonas aeruginosa]HCU2029524.1 endonuclease domain-containing protein [Pseudomonas aeruginosa]